MDSLASRQGRRQLRAGAVARLADSLYLPVINVAGTTPAGRGPLRYGARVDQRYNGATPLHYAVEAGFKETIRVLVDHGADMDALDDRGRTPRDWLVVRSESRRRNIANLKLDRKAWSIEAAVKRWPPSPAPRSSSRP